MTATSPAERVEPVTPARYAVDVAHRRQDPINYRFAQRSSTWLIDLDHVPRMPLGLSRLVRFDAADHFGDPALTLRANVDEFLAGYDIAAPSRVMMLANPRVLGYVFNPLSVFYCFTGNELTHLIAEVRNTYGGRHSYLLQPDDHGRAETDKHFYVSPFYPVDGEYTMALPVPDERLRVTVTMRREGDRPFVATMTGRRQHADRPSRLGSALTSPLATRAVMFGIKRHGITLYFKGLRPYARREQDLRDTASTAIDRPHSESEISMTALDNRPAPTAASSAPARRRTATIDRELWPDIAVVPAKPIHANVARRLLKRATAHLPLRVTTADGERFGAGTATDPNIHLVKPDAFYARLGSSGLIGFGESFMAGEWESDDLAGVLTVMASRMASLIPAKLQRLRKAVLHARPSEQDNTVDGARDNIHRHYDLSNELFGLFLDESLSYSSALFEGDPDHNSAALLEAQHRKIDRLLDTAAVGPGTRVLEIGTGWGELSLRAAARGAQVTTVTISTEQAELATKRIAQAGYAEQVDVRLQDYREVTGQYDAVISVEMIEAVGANHWDEYFGAIADRLVPGGRVALQAITMPHDRMIATQNTYTWIIKYIFPGGHLPSVRSIRENVDAAGLRMSSEFTFGLHYAETLRRWRDTFEGRATEVDSLGFDEVFRRMWSLYLAYSEAGFRSRYLDVVQFGFVKPNVPAGVTS